MPGKVKKGFSLALAALLVAILLAGCSQSIKITLNENGSGRYEESATITKTLWDAAFAKDGYGETILSYMQALYPEATITVSDETIDGAAFKTLRMEMDFKDLSDFRQILSDSKEMMSVNFNQNYFSISSIYMPFEDDAENTPGIAGELEQLLGADEEALKELAHELQAMDASMTVAFPYAVADTNGSVQEDGKTVVWDMGQPGKSARLYALFQADNTLPAPNYTGAVNGKAYNTGVALAIHSENLLSKVDVNGEAVASDYLFLFAEGLYTVTATDVAGNSSKVTFRIDTTKPSVHGVADGKTYKTARTIKFSDQGSGVKKASLNGKPVKTGKKVSQKGDYTLEVADKAGNQNIVAFTIK